MAKIPHIWKRHKPTDLRGWVNHNKDKLKGTHTKKNDNQTSEN